VSRHRGRARSRKIASLAGQQRGLVTRAQLLEFGLTRHAIDNWVRSGRLRAIHRGVYLLGLAEPPEGARELAALLACGPGAVISHRSAAALWHLLPGRPSDVDVTLAGRHCGPKRGIRIHRVRTLDRRDVRQLDTIPITTPARTLLDVAAVLPARNLEQAFAEAQARRLVYRSHLASLLARHPTRPGTRVLRQLIAADTAPALTRSEAEERFLALIRNAELPAPEVNARLAGYEVDFLWREQGLVVEVDGFTFHGSRAAFERDRRRDADLIAGGFRVMRVTWQQIVGAPEALVVRLATALATGSRT
jgi:very-short-patch-repair endonuclease